MARRLILSYRKMLDASATRPWERLVLDDSYRELRMQAQYFDQAGQFGTYAELLRGVPGAERLPGLVSAAVVGYLRQLDGLVPDVVDNLGRRCLKFSNFRFEIINSDLRDPARHHVAINFFSEPLRWHDTVGGFLLLSDGPVAAPGTEQPVYQVALQPYLAVHALLPDLPTPEKPVAA